MAEENLEYDIGADEQEATISINEDGTEAVMEEQAEEVKAEAPEQEAPQEDKDELDQYSDNVQKRINKLTARLREHQRREQAALDYAKNVQARAQELEQRFEKTDTERMSEAKSRLETQTVALKQIIRKAREEGDFDTEAEAQERLTAAMWEQQKMKEAESAAEQRRAAMEQQTQHQPQVQQQQAPRRVDPRAEQWAEQNEWFGKDTAMTHAAIGIHQEMVNTEGFDPQSEEYYDELDKRVRATFPGKFAQAEGSQEQPRATKPVQTVASATRSSGVTNNARRSVRLSPSQVAIAKKLGVPLEEYAKYVKD